VIGVGRTETHAATTLDHYADALEARGMVFPILPVDVRQRADVISLIDTLLGQIEAGMDMDLQ
jgi:hypothetical protein